MGPKKSDMSYAISFERRPGYLYARITGHNSRLNVIAYMAELRRKCEAADCFRVLVDERLEGPRLPAMDVFDIVSDGSMRSLGLFEAIAFVDRRMGEMGQFAETVAVNRGMPLAVFTDVEDAERWLMKQRDGTDEQYIFWDGETPKPKT